MLSLGDNVGPPSVLAGRHTVLPASEAPSPASYPAQGKPGVTERGVDLGAGDQCLWIPTDCVSGVMLAAEDHR